MSPVLFTHLFQEELYDIPSKVLVILARAWDNYSPEDKTLLTKILGSIKLSPDSVQFVVQKKLSLALVSSYNPAKVLVFGSADEGIKPYEATQVQGFWLIKADDLNQLDDAKKKNLWFALKNTFGL